jgi:predicted nucleic acid-binding protein
VILYLGSSSLVKLYVQEPYSDLVREWVRQAEIVATCRVAYTETISALDTRFRVGDLSKHDYERIVKGFSKDWASFATVDFDEVDAGKFVKKHGLRRFDAMHLSAAILIRRVRGDTVLRFSSLDERLCKAAVSEGLKVLKFD